MRDSLSTSGGGVQALALGSLPAFSAPYHRPVHAVLPSALGL